MKPLASLPGVRSLFEGASIPDLGTGPRAGVWTIGQIDAAVDELCDRLALQPARRTRLRALLLLWHDHAEPAHALVQEGADADSAFIHAILHRREPDFSNAKYWFRRVREHPCYPELAAEVAVLLVQRGEADLAARLVPQGRWDPLAFVDACEEMAADSGKVMSVKSLCEVQQREFAVLAEHLCRRS